jgi:thioredoxin-related protein
MIRTLPKLAVLFLAALVVCIPPSSGQQRQTAVQVLSSAKSAAAKDHKHIFLVFGASWCPPCHLLDAFLKDKQMRPLIEKHFVVAEIAVEEERGKHPELNTVGGEELRTTLGGKESGVPFIVFLDEKGNPVTNSFRDDKRDQNVGYPVLAEEIDWFMTMLRKTLPSQTAADARAIQTWLKAVAATQPQ